ncbi:MAG: DUF2062 domain-containing protein [Candidatus Berkiellales bacterium]
MAKKLIKRFLPDPKTIQNNKYLNIFGSLLNNPNLWLINRYSFAKACSIGLFVTYFPLPGHMIFAAFLAILFRANLPISVALVWVINPLTMIPMYAFAFSIGAMLLDISIQDLDFYSLAVFKDMWQPFVLGCLICGTFLSIAGNLGARLLWRYYVGRSWLQRRRKRSLANSDIPAPIPPYDPSA